MASLPPQTPPTDHATPVDDLPLSRQVKKLLRDNGYTTLGDFAGLHLPDLFPHLSFTQVKVLLGVLLERNIEVRFRDPNWTEDAWRTFLETLVTQQIVSWKEIALAVCGELNPPQVGTAIASNESFQRHFPPRETMRNVMAWFYAQSGKCSVCGTRLYLEADHIRSKQEYRERGEPAENADTLNNLQLLCKRCNVIKRPSHALGGISFAPAQSVLIWILLALRPNTREAFYALCRGYGLTMANIRFDEAWAFAEWLRREGKYPN